MELRENLIVPIIIGSYNSSVFKKFQKIGINDLSHAGATTACALDHWNSPPTSRRRQSPDGRG